MQVQFNASLSRLFGRPDAATKVGKIMQNAAQSTRRDSLTLSSDYRKQQNGGKDDFLLTLIEQKENLKKQREAELQKDYVDDADVQLTKDKVKLIDEQLSSINQQIKDYMIQKQKEAVEVDKEEGSGSSDGLTREEAQAKQMEKIAEANVDLEASRQMRQTRAELKRHAAYLKDSASDTGLSASGNEARQDKIGAEISKVENGISGLESTEKSLLSDAQELAEQTAKLGEQAAEAPESTETETGKTEQEQQTGTAETGKENEDDSKTVTDAVAEATEKKDEDEQQ